MSTTEPPPFQEAPRCVVCNCSFNTFRRRHHCRRCGRTLCNEHSSDQMALPQFGIYSNVRVCADCFNNSRSEKGVPQASSDGVNRVTHAISKLDIDANVDSKTKPNAENNQTVSSVKECKCGMPLCICEVIAPSSDSLPQQKKSTPVVTAPSNPKTKKTDTVPKNRGSSSTSKFSSTFNLGNVTSGTSNRPQTDYEANGEGLREAIKNGDVAAVKKLLNQGVDANYRDKQGLSLLHLAAVFNQTDIVFTLMDSGASLEYKNAQDETPLDCAPATLQYKMRKKMEEGGAMDQSI
ncbi:PREDICTED: vacuolar protein sorting-associated protein 27 isoform X2 [Lupinus angustifolius]|uniref:vacuolar protein sorting-associated protein 27 isoform X2 n=1 Tax=Lupinus angustifolius TaxID=3871 RepID=UPI00092F2778|nr:PREDICTED: vacuolar protein sorting-associated protein 27 isoform X2 [Lupinus angustifolius]